MGDSRQPINGPHHGLLWCECVDIVYVEQQRQSHRDDSGRRTRRGKSIASKPIWLQPRARMEGNAGIYILQPSFEK